MNTIDVPSSIALNNNQIQPKFQHYVYLKL